MPSSNDTIQGLTWLLVMLLERWRDRGSGCVRTKVEGAQATSKGRTLISFHYLLTFRASLKASACNARTTHEISTNRFMYSTAHPYSSFRLGP